MVATDHPPTAFQSRVYDVVRTIPKGKVRTYGSIAKELKTSARAVGTAMGKNPFASTDVPWHRVVASDLTLGGFCHSWGEDQPKVQKKKRMLEDEGIRFEPDGKKILKQYFVGNEKEESKVRFAKKRKEEKTINQQPATCSTFNNSVLVDEITEEMLKKEILDLLNKQALGKTCWPSEIPRALSKRGELSPGVDWRSLMEPTRVAARSLVSQGKVDVMQKGNVLSKEQEYRGPIRLRLHIAKKDR